MVEQTEMIPGADFEGSGKPLGGFVLIVLVLSLRDQEGRVLNAEIQPMPVSLLRLIRPWPRRVAVEERDEQRRAGRRFDLQANAGRGEWVGRSAARQIVDRDSRPVAVDEQRAVIADEELPVGCELAKSEARLASEQRLLQPKLREADGWMRLDVADREQPADVGASYSAGATGAKAIRLEA